MPTSTILQRHVATTRKLALALKGKDVFDWLVQYGYFPESYVLPPCFAVVKRPSARKLNFSHSKSSFRPDRTECTKVHFPKTSLTDRTFGIMDPHIHNDIACNSSRSWKSIVAALVPKASRVASYSFPVPLDAELKGRVGTLRGGRMIYEFLSLIEEGITSVAYRYRYIVRTDIRNFFPSIYTHSLAWALHGKRRVRRPANLRNYSLLGNRLDKLFQNANDGCTNGIPIGPAVSDIAAEIIASAVDVELSKSLKTSARKIECEIVRFKDDYRILVKSEEDGQLVIKHLQAALKSYNLELADDKTSISALPDGLFRDWRSMYHSALPRRKVHFSWTAFRELYLAVLRIEAAHPGTGVIDRFLADIISSQGRLKVDVDADNLQRVVSLLLMLATKRTKSFPKVIAIIESILNSRFGRTHEPEIVAHLDAYLSDLAADEDRNRYLITWISYFLVSNGLKKYLSKIPKLRDPIARSALSSRSNIFRHRKDYTLFLGCRAAAQKVSLLQHLELFK